MILVLLLLIAMTQSAPSDVCLSQIPSELQSLVSKDYPQYRLPKVNDNRQEDIQYNRDHGGNGCLGVATADMDGDGRSDVALLLTDKRKDRAILVAARNLRNGWQTETLMDMGNDRASLYVDPIDPGQYESVLGKDEPLTEKGQVASINSRLPGIISGTIESSGVAFFHTSKGWRHIWLSD